MPGLKQRVKTLVELIDMSAFLFESRPLTLEPGAAAQLTPESRDLLARLLPILESASDWTVATLEARVRDFAAAEQCSLGMVAQPLRAALAGRKISPPIFDVLYALDREESLGRIADQCTGSGHSAPGELASGASPQGHGTVL
jgi:glutamyl-tRNA synthetase